MNQEILEKAIRLAIDGGWKFPLFVDSTGSWVCLDHEVIHKEQIIFNHDFAKALWGEETEIFTENFPKSLNKYKKNYQVPKWAIRLQQMLIAEDPIAYLGEHLPQ